MSTNSLPSKDARILLPEKCYTVREKVLRKLVIDESVKNSWEFSGTPPRTFHHSFQNSSTQHLAPGFLGDILDRLTGVASLAFASDFCRCDF